MFLCLGLAINWVVEALRPVTRLLQLVPTATGSKSSLLRSVSSLLLGGSSSIVNSGSKSPSSSSSVFPLSWLFSSNDVSKQAQEIVRGVNAAAARNGFSPSSAEVQVQEMNQYESLSGMGNTQQAMRKSIVVGYMDVDLYASVRGRRGPSGARDAGLQRDIWSRD
jgi:hypothetical protein